MQQAYTNLYGSSMGINETNIYVRFKPASPQQLSILEDLDIDLYDYPLDYDVAQQGDYYDDGVTPAEEIPWLYAVVDINFTPPSGIQYEELERIHLPVLANIENEAFRITGNPIDYYDCGSMSPSGGSSKTITPDIPDCGEDYHWDYTLRQCVPNNCPDGYHWEIDQCVPNTPAPPSPRPARQPAGNISVFDTNLGTNRPVRNARMVARRFLKVESTYTNNQGQFAFNKEFNKVNLLVKFTNDQAKIRALRRARLWQMLLPVQIRLGKFSGYLNNITHVEGYNNDAVSRGARHWAAATAHK